MNCRQVQSLVSPYLDQQLSGQHMMEMHAHLQGCPHCAKECHAVQQIRQVLRALPTKIPHQTLEARMILDASRPAGFLPTEVRLPQRGRHFARALALSGLGLLMFSAPFAPAAFDEERLPYLRTAHHAISAVPGTVFVVDMGTAANPDLAMVRLSPVPPTLTVNPLSHSSFVHVVPVPVPTAQARSLPLSVWGGTDPLQTQGTGSDLSLVGYHSR